MSRKPENELTPQARYERERSKSRRLVKIWLSKEEGEALDAIRGNTPAATWVGDIVRSILSQSTKKKK